MMFMKGITKGLVCSAVTAIFLLTFALSANAQSKNLKTFQFPLESGCINTFLAPDRTAVRVDASQEQDDVVPTGCYPVVAMRPAPPVLKTATAEPKKEVTEFFSVYFDFDKYNIRPSEVPILDKAAAFIKDKEAAKVLVSLRSVGNACSCGKPAYNHNLAMKRAITVQNELQKRGVKSKITVVSLGEEYAGKNHQHDRRVTINVIFNK
jgi:outer membrane protein OmpA-like peptidoglycan-associated protein